MKNKIQRSRSLRHLETQVAKNRVKGSQSEEAMRRVEVDELISHSM